MSKEDVVVPGPETAIGESCVEVVVAGSFDAYVVVEISFTRAARSLFFYEQASTSQGLKCIERSHRS